MPTKRRPIIKDYRGKPLPGWRSKRVRASFGSLMPGVKGEHVTAYGVSPERCLQLYLDALHREGVPTSR